MADDHDHEHHHHEHRPMEYGEAVEQYRADKDGDRNQQQESRHEHRELKWQPCSSRGALDERRRCDDDADQGQESIRSAGAGYAIRL